jgi:hypothetical protein
LTRPQSHRADERGTASAQQLSNFQKTPILAALVEKTAQRLSRIKPSWAIEAISVPSRA